jgi:class 3 adenylate cyclase
VRRNNGRIDQIWGDGVLAIFGEYLDTKDSTARPGCRYALQAAGELTERAREFADDWLKNVFELDEYIKAYAEEVTMSVAIAIHHGEVAFNYVGGKDNVVYIALGNEVSFVKQLVQVEDDKPILLSRTAEFWSREVLRDAVGEPSGNVRKPRLISFPGRPEQYPIYPITPANIDLLST